MKATLCAYCRTHPVDPRFRPFCSRRCKMLDLARWADGTYRVPAGPSEEDEVPEEEHDDDEQSEV